MPVSPSDGRVGKTVAPSDSQCCGRGSVALAITPSCCIAMYCIASICLSAFHGCRSRPGLTPTTRHAAPQSPDQEAPACAALSASATEMQCAGPLRRMNPANLNWEKFKVAVEPATDAIVGCGQLVPLGNSGSLELRSLIVEPSHRRVPA